MKIPQTPPRLNDLISEVKSSKRLMELFSQKGQARTQRHYLHWDKLRRYSPPEGMSHREWWMILKL